MASGAAHMPPKTPLEAIRNEISYLEANITKVEQWIVEMQKIKDLSEDQRANLKEWRIDRKQYEAKLEKARAEERAELARLQSGECSLMDLRCC